MPDRRFLIASSFARLIERQRGTQNEVVEGYFPPRPGRRQVVRVESAAAYLTLTSMPGEGPVNEERVAVPKGHAEALLDVTPGVIGFSRTGLALAGGGEAVLDRFSRPGRLDTLTVSFADADQAGEAEPVPAEAAERTEAAPDEIPGETTPSTRVEVDRARDRAPGLVSDLARMLPTRRVG